MTLRPPLMSKGQANDFYSYMTIGTGLMWLAGGVAAGPAAITLGLCGAGAIANNHRGGGQNARNPQMSFTPEQAAPPPPLDDGLPSPEAVAYVKNVEDDLKKQFGINAVYCYRNMVREGYDTGSAYKTLFDLLGPLKQQGYWKNGQIQSGNVTPKELLDQIMGRRAASPELQKYLNNKWFRDLYDEISGDNERDGLDPLVNQGVLDHFSMMLYILGLEPISDKPVRRIKHWVDRGNHPLYYVADWNWFCGGPLHQFRERWEDVLRMSGLPNHLADEAESLFEYRVEIHRGEAPPGHPGGVLWSSVFFGRTKSFPATEEDMRGKE